MFVKKMYDFIKKKMLWMDKDSRKINQMNQYTYSFEMD